MSTRSLIAALMPDNTVKEIYCHHDGYLSGVGMTLKDYYTNISKITKLMKLGSLSALYENIGVKHPFDCPHGMDYTQFRELYQGMTTAYHRDRGEKLHIGTYSSVDEWKEKGGWTNDSWQEYVYFWDGTEWTCTGYYELNETDISKNKQYYITIDAALKIEELSNQDA